MHDVCDLLDTHFSQTIQLLHIDPPLPIDMPAGESLIKALYGQANELPASLFDLGISPFINAQILMFVLLIIPEQLLPQTQWMSKLRQARKEGKSVSRAAAGQLADLMCACWHRSLGRSLGCIGWPS